MRWILLVSLVSSLAWSEGWDSHDDPVLFMPAGERVEEILVENNNLKKQLSGISKELENVRLQLGQDSEIQKQLKELISAGFLPEIITIEEFITVVFEIKKADTIRDMVVSIAKIPDVIKQEVYLKECSRIMDISEQVLFNTLAQILQKDKKEATKKAKKTLLVKCLFRCVLRSWFKLN